MSQAELKVPPLSLKPDLDEAVARWMAFWEQDLIDRPLCAIRAPREGVEPVPAVRYLAGANEPFGPVVEQAVAHAETVYWGGEAIPHYVPSFGPDQIAAFLGAELVFPEASGATSWALPCIDDWSAALPLTLDPDNPWWRRMREFLAALAKGFAGKLLVAHLDLHSNLDTLLAMRGGERLCLDLLDCPETIDRAMAEVRALYEPVYAGLFEAGGMTGRGTVGWVPVYHPVRTNTIQCDFAALIGTEHFRRWALPALADEAAYLGHCVYHLDGPECLIHVPDLCAVPGLDCIQWTTGARNKPFEDWLDLLKDIQARGTAVWVPCTPDSLRWFHRELDPRLVFYVCSARGEREADETLRWLVDNT